MTIITPGAVVSPFEPAAAMRGAASPDSGFRVPGGADGSLAQAAVSVGGSAPACQPGVILALQEEQVERAGGEGQARDREARRQARELLQALAGLQREVLEGSVSPAALARLGTLTQIPGCASDPGLARILEAIRLRACLEVLRQERLAGCRGRLVAPGRA